MYYDKIRDNIWVYSMNKALQIAFKNEDKDAWKFYLEKN